MYLPLDPKGTMAEYNELCARDTEAFWGRYAPIHPADELRNGLEDRQAAYLSWLLESAENVVVDLTRCSFKLTALREIDPSAVLIHLHRSPAAVATSHLLPSRTDFIGRVRRHLLQRTFWTRRVQYNSWNFEGIIGNSVKSPFGSRVREIDLDPALVFAMPAVGRLLAYWRINYEQVEANGPALFERYYSVNFEDFARSPRCTLEEIYKLFEIGYQHPDLRDVRAPKPPFQPRNPSWLTYGRELGLPYIFHPGEGQG